MPDQLLFIVIVTCVVALGLFFYQWNRNSAQSEERDDSHVCDAFEIEAPQLSAMEESCLQTLQVVAGAEYFIRKKTTLGEIFPLTEDPQLIVEFTLFRKTDNRAVCVVQLQLQSDNIERKIEESLAHEGVALYRLPRKSSYSILKMRDTLQSHMRQPVPSPEEMIATISMQTFRPCPKCETQMNLRRIKSGPHKGVLFWVCGDSPICEGIELYTDKE